MLLTRKWMALCGALVWTSLSFASAGVVEGSDTPSVYPTRLDDPHAVYLTPDRFPVTADGLADDAAVLQEAIDRAGTNSQAGVLFVPSGTYRLGTTVYVWPGVRLIGYGPTRPVFVLGENTPGFQEGEGRYMLYFSGGRGRNSGDPPRDGSPGTFYSALSNIDIEIRQGNPAAVGVRFHVAQHCYLSHMEFRLGSAKAGLEDIGNLVEDLHFQGGEYGILTRRSAPGWPIVVMDCTFQGQRTAAIHCDEAGLAVVRPRFTDVPTAVSIAPGKPDQLWVSDALLENVTGPAFVISQENNPRTQVNLQNAVCRNVPVLAQLRQSSEVIPGLGAQYRIEQFTRGLHLDATGASREILSTLVGTAMTDPIVPVPSDIPPLPSASSWVNVRSLGVTGDGQTDDTAALKAAIAQHPTLYLPLGVYRVSDTLKLRPDTVLVGLNPSATVIHLPNHTPAFQDSNSPKPVIETRRAGRNILSGIGVYAAPLNPAAIAIKWMAGADSLVNDVRLHGGHGTRLPGGIGDSRGRDHRESWDSQPASLWVTSGGGGIFKNIWTPSPYARAGLLVSETSTSGRLYAMSAEHHVSHEVILRNVSNWQFDALQFEEEREESPKALPLQIDGCSNLRFANTFFYRVVSCFVPYPFAVGIRNSSNIRFRNVQVYSNSKVSFDSSIHDETAGTEVRDSQFALLDVSGAKTSFQRPTPRGVRAPGAEVEQLADGFLNISGATVDDQGDVYFADPRELQIYRWRVAEGRLERVRAVPQRPEQLAFDRTGNLLVIAYEGKGTVMAFNPKAASGELIPLEVQPAAARVGKTPVLPVNRWTSGASFLQDSTLSKPHHYVSPDGTTFIPAGDEFMKGAVRWGTKLADLLRAFRLAPAVPGQRFYISNERELQTWSFLVGPEGALTDPQLFVEEGGEGVAVDGQGHVYIAAGQVRVFSPGGALIETIRVPQRPTCLVFGGEDRKTLFIAARSALYSIRIQ